MSGLDRGRLNDLIRFERKVPASSTDVLSAGSESWEQVGEESWAEVLDVLPGRGVTVEGPLNMAAHPTRITLDQRGDVTTSMRVVFGSRVMRIVSGPANIGTRGDGMV